MKTNNYLIKIKTAAEFVITFCLVYFTFTYPIPFFFSAIMLIVALFVFMQALDNVDTINNFGNKNKPQHDNHDYNQETTDTYQQEENVQEPEPTYPDDNTTDNKLPDINDNSDFLIDNTSDFHSMDNIME